MSTALAVPDLAEGQALARATTRAGSRSFYFASRVLDGPRRAAAYALYAFFRAADDAADGDPTLRLRRLYDRQCALARVYHGVPRDPLEQALAQAVLHFGIPRGPIEELLGAVAGDLGRVRIQSWAELDRYCHGVASTVGLAMAPLLGAPAEAAPEAAALGRAMQLTNILRDVKEDLVQLDRIYLPAEAMARHGLAEDDLRAEAVTEGFRRLASEVAERAHAAYDASESGIRAIAPWRSRTTVRLMRAAYREILCEIERRRFDVFRERVVISTGRKLVLAAGVLLGADPAAPATRVGHSSNQALQG